jgi:hypothetical protein
MFFKPARLAMCPKMREMSYCWAICGFLPITEKISFHSVACANRSTGQRAVDGHVVEFAGDHRLIDR